MPPSATWYVPPDNRSAGTSLHSFVVFVANEPRPNFFTHGCGGVEVGGVIVGRRDITGEAALVLVPKPAPAPEALTAFPCSCFSVAEPCFVPLSFGWTGFYILSERPATQATLTPFAVVSRGRVHYPRRAPVR